MNKSELLEITASLRESAAYLRSKLDEDADFDLAQAVNDLLSAVSRVEGEVRRIE